MQNSVLMGSSQNLRALEDAVETLTVDLSAVVASPYSLYICNRLVSPITTSLDSCRSVFAGHGIVLTTVPSSLPESVIR